ncbi:MAG: L-threonylcarbamoyladenylate synthase [Gammaproteobacteria bacterium]
MIEQNQQLFDHAIAALQQGGVIAYPTEAVYGLGCDPFNETAVMQLLQIKRRAVTKGLILIAANWDQVAFLTQPLPAAVMVRIRATWPGPVTWVFPASTQVPPWIRGQHATIALRITAHPIASQLCRHYGKTIVSTSANREGETPASDAETVKQLFGTELDFIVPGEVGGLVNPTEIRDVLSGKILR